MRSQLNARSLGGQYPSNRVDLNRNYQRHYWNLVFRLASRERVAGIIIGTLLPLFPRDRLLAKTSAALELIAQFDPRQFDRLRHLAGGIFIFDETGSLGTWLRGSRLIRLNEAFVAAPDTTDAEVAGTIVHETTHAWLEARGFAYHAERRRRIEAICYRAEAAFARRLPDGATLANYYEERAKDMLAQTDDELSDAALLARDVARLRTLGSPEWFVKWLAQRRSRAA